MTTPADKSPDSISPGKSVEPIQKPVTPQSTAGDFQSYMQGTAAPKAPPPGTPGAPNPMELSRGASFQTAGPSFDSLLAQSRTAQDSLGTVEKQLKEPNLKLKRSQSHLMRNKLSDANEYLRAAGSKIGAEASPQKTPAGSSPIDRFLGYVNDGQDQLMAVQKKLKEISGSGKPINPADMLLVQVKMGLAQQEIEYSSTLLSKVIDSIKQVINTQL